MTIGNRELGNSCYLLLKCTNFVERNLTVSLVGKYVLLVSSVYLEVNTVVFA